MKCQRDIEGESKCSEQCDHCKEYYAPLEEVLTVNGRIYSKYLIDYAPVEYDGPYCSCCGESHKIDKNLHKEECIWYD